MPSKAKPPGSGKSKPVLPKKVDAERLEELPAGSSVSGLLDECRGPDGSFVKRPSKRLRRRKPKSPKVVLQDVWASWGEVGGVEFLKELRALDPVAYANIIQRLLPKEQAESVVKQVTFVLFPDVPPEGWKAADVGDYVDEKKES